MSKFRRILVLGAPGSGKSYVSQKIHETFDLPQIILDRQYWSANWKPSDLFTFRQTCYQLAQEDQWVMDGNFGVTFKERWARADLVIYLDPSPWLCTLRQILRLLHLSAKINRPENCSERFNSQLFWLTYKFRSAHGRLIEKKMREEFPHVTFLKGKNWEHIKKNPLLFN